MGELGYSLLLGAVGSVLGGAKPGYGGGGLPPGYGGTVLRIRPVPYAVTVSG